MPRGDGRGSQRSRGEDRLGGRGRLRRRRTHALQRRAGHPRGAAPLARGALEALRLEGNRVVPRRACGAALRRGHRYARPAEERAHCLLRRRTEARNGPRQRARAARGSFLRSHARAAAPRRRWAPPAAREPLAALFYDRTHAVPRALHAVERNRRLMAASLGVALPPGIDYGLRSNAERAAALPASYSVRLTMTSREAKLWPEPRWIELGRALALPAVLPWGNAEERSRAERIAQGIGEAVIPERMALEELAQVLAGATNVVGLDSGLSHLAAAFGAPAVAVFCGSDPALTGLYGAPRARNVGARGRPPQGFEE